MLKNYKLIIRYDGTKYKGWEHQPGTDMTIQGKMELAVIRMLNPSGKAQRFKLRIPSGWQVKYYYDPAESRELTAESFELKPYCSALVRLERE